MGKLLYTNNPIWAESIRKIYSSAGFKIAHEDKNGINLISYKKLSANSYNYSQNSDVEAYCSGTLIYGEFFGDEALKNMCRDYKSYGIDYVKKQVRGSFAVALRDKENTYIFVDNVATYSFYYYIDYNNKNFIFTNMFTHIAKCTKSNVNRLAYLEWVLTVCILDNETPFDNIFRVRADEIIVINNLTSEVEFKKASNSRTTMSINSKDDVVDALLKHIEKYNNIKKRYFKRNIVFVTGGVDSRLMLASDYYVGIRPECHYWGGDSGLQNFNPIDYNTGKKLAQIVGSEYVYHDISGDFVHNVLTDDDYDLMGDYSDLYGGNKNLNTIYLSFDGDSFVDYGYFGELLTDWKHLEDKWHDGFSLADFVKEVYWNRYNCSREYIEILGNRIYEKFSSIATQFDMEKNNLRIEDCMILYSFYRTRADVVMCNYSNMFCNHFMLLGQEEIFCFHALC